MPIRYDAVLVRALASELTERLSGRRLEELHFDGESRRIRLVVTGGEELVWLLHPTEGHLLERPSRRERARRRTASRGVLTGARDLGSVTAGADERRLVFELGTDSLVVELHTNQWNALLLSDDTIRRVLWPRRAGGRPLFPNAHYVPPGTARQWAEDPPSAEEWSTWWDSCAGSSREDSLVREIAWSSRLNVEFLLADGPTPGAVRDRLMMIHPGSAPQQTIAGTSSTSVGSVRWLLQRGPALQPYPLSLEEEGAEPSPSLLTAMKTSAEAAGIPGTGPEDEPSGPIGRTDAHGPDVAPVPDRRRPAEREEHDRLEEALRRRLARARKRTAALRRQLEEGDESGRLRESGQLLLARKQDVSRGADQVTLRGFDGHERTISLDPAVNAVRNAERYFDRARRRERAERELPARIEAARDKEIELSEALETLALSGVSDALWQKVGGRDSGLSTSSTRSGKPELARLPYRRLRSDGGLEIRVGRSARGNDDLTFRHSAPEDIWLHVRQAPGAHVILRWGNRDQNPPDSEIRAAALVAAEFSDARSSGLVPVDWTRRKYVRKPRKSSPGSVIPDRVRTVFVEPDPAHVRKMLEAGPDAS
ncbi:MAG: NFACT RNA binding domain-containing protein [marine benthic group bacterium]|nr:NFACT RNA binding domain-containing protein [Gemmatimonadota bacterium]